MKGVPALVVMRPCGPCPKSAGGHPVVLRMHPDSPAPVFMASEHFAAEGLYRVEPLTLSRLVRAVLRNLWALNLYRLRWWLWRLGFVDVSPGEKWGDARWRWRWWRPRYGAEPASGVKAGQVREVLAGLGAQRRVVAARRRDVN